MKRAGFTLLELSIVVVIVALLAAGVMVGKDLIQAAQVRSTLKQIEMINVAVNTFKGQYKCLPGDCATAHKWNFQMSPFGGMLLSDNKPVSPPWFAFDLIASAYAGAAPIEPDEPELEMEEFALVNGDGNGEIEGSAEYFNGVYELYQAELINGFEASTGHIPLALPGPSTTSGKGILFVQHLTPITDSSISEPGHYVWITTSVDADASGVAVLRPKDLSAIDAKIDDNLPRSGKVLATSRNTNPSTMSGGPLFAALTDSGAAGASSNFCVTNASTPQYNVANTARVAGALCVGTIAMDF
jgi:prepilin-type N-terminal cleavage/methylation domain-containing protein